MKAKGKELEFIAQIKRDGSCLEKVDDASYLDNDIFELHCLSITYKTYIAHGFNSFIVKLITS